MQVWHKGLEAATRLNMPYEQALAHLEIGQHVPDGDPQRQSHLARARDIFAQVDAPFFRARAEQLLATDQIVAV